MLTDVSPERPKNAQCPIFFTELGMVVFLQPAIKVFVAVSMMALQLLRESYVVLPASTLTDVSPVQFENAQSPIFFTEFGMLTDVSPLQYMNAQFPMLVTESGRSTYSRLSHLANASSPMLVTESGMLIDFSSVQPANA